MKLRTIILALAVLIIATGCSHVLTQDDNSVNNQSPETTPAKNSVFGDAPDSQKTDLDEGSLPPAVEELDSPGSNVTSYSLKDVAAHGSANDCWVVIHGSVYDVTGYVRKHPGGNAIIEGCGTDATVLFETRPMGSGTPHSSRARSTLEGFYIGELN